MTTPHIISRRNVIAGLGAGALLSASPLPAFSQEKPWRDAVLEKAKSFEALRSLVVWRGGEPLIEEVFRGGPLDRGVNIKSLSKTVLSVLVGIAIDKGELEGPDQKIAPLLGRLVPEDADPRLAEVTIGNLLSMQSGLKPTSGPNYGRWVQSPNWVRFALEQPFVEEPGGKMLYSTGNSHLLSAILTRVTGKSTLELAREWLGRPLEITVAPWPTDPQGIFFGGNDMVLSPKGLALFGEMARSRGKIGESQHVSAKWLELSWLPRTSSPWTGHAYGYGWFLRDVDNHPVRYGWGYGGQMLFVTPDAELTVVMISDPNAPSGRNGYVRQLHELHDEILRGVTGAA